MSHKGNQILSEIEDKKVSVNGEDDNTEASVHTEVKQEIVTTMKTRSKRSTPIKTPSDDAKPKEVKEIESNIDKINEVEEKIEESNTNEKKHIEKIEELNTNEKEHLEKEEKTEELNGSCSSPINVESSIESSENLHESNDQSENDPEVEQKEKDVSKEDFILDSETFMEPLVLQPDEPCPELEFEESSDKESEKHSPVLSRCRTRRSQNRNIPTPNTPRLMCEPELEKDHTDSEKGSGPRSERSLKITNFNDTEGSSTNVSMTVQVGGDVTRTDFSDGESELLQSLRSKGSNSSRYLSSRRSIRSLRSDVHSKSLRDSLHRKNLYVSSPLGRESMERAPSVKRKGRSETPEERKKPKTDSSGFLSKFSSPLSNLRNKFSTSPTGTSTPKLTSYKDEKNHIDGDYFDQVEMPEGAADPQNRWCEIM